MYCYSVHILVYNILFTTLNKIIICFDDTFHDNLLIEFTYKAYEYFYD